jgi:hypothetical protein
MSFTGNKNIDMDMMLLLSDHEVGVVCQVNKYAEKLCNDSSFWTKRIIQKYKVFPDKINLFIQNFHFANAKNLYIYLTQQVSDGSKLLLWMDELLKAQEQQRPKKVIERNFWIFISQKYPDVSPITLREMTDLFERLYRQ